MYPEALPDKGKRLLVYLKQFKDFYLAGGTAVALQIGHRISVDFDLFSKKEIAKSLLARVEKVLTNIRVTVSVNNSDDLTLFAEDTKITFLYYPFPTIRPCVKYEGITVLSLKELAVTKAYTIGRRGSFKDYVDLYYLLTEKHTSIKEILSIAERKYHDNFNSRLFLEQLIYLEDITDTNIIFLKKGVNKEVIKGFFEKEVKKLQF